MSPVVSSRAGVSARGYGFLAPAAAVDAVVEAVGGFEAIATVTAAGGEYSLSFTNIPQTYVALQIRGVARTTLPATGSTTIRLRMNGDTGTNYMTHYLNGDGATVTAGTVGPGSTWRDWIGRAPNLNVGSWGATITDVHDYASTTRNKTTRTFAGVDGNAAVANNNYMVVLSSGLWVSTAAVISVTLYVSGSAFAAGSTFALYGIRGAA